MSTTKARMSFVQLTQSLYNGLGTYDANSLYFCTDTSRIYLGTTLMSRPAQVVSALPDSGQLENTVYIRTTDGTIHYWDGSSYTKVGGSDSAITSVTATNKTLTTTTAGGTTVSKRIGGLFNGITYANGVLTLSTTTDDGASNSSSVATVNIPVEQYLSSVSRKEVAAEDLTGSDAAVYTGCSAGDIGVLFTMVDGSKMFVKLTDLVDTYTTASSATDLVQINVNGYGISATLNFDSNHFETDGSTGALKIKASAVKSLIAVSGATENNVVLFDANGNAKDGGFSINTTDDYENSNSTSGKVLVTEKTLAGVVSKIVAGNIGDSLSGKLNKVSSEHAGEIVTATADGGVEVSGKTIGGATLDASPSSNKLATEAAVADALSWTIITSD